MMNRLRHIFRIFKKMKLIQEDSHTGRRDRAAEPSATRRRLAQERLGVTGMEMFNRCSKVNVIPQGFLHFPFVSVRRQESWRSGSTQFIQVTRYSGLRHGHGAAPRQARAQPSAAVPTFCGLDASVFDGIESVASPPASGRLECRLEPAASGWRRQLGPLGHIGTARSHRNVAVLQVHVGPDATSQWMGRAGGGLAKAFALRVRAANSGSAARLRPQPRPPKQMTNLRVPLQRSDGRAQWQNPCYTKRLLSLIVIRAINIHRKV